MSKFLDSIRDKTRVKHLSYKTEKSYVDWAERYILFPKWRRFSPHLQNLWLLIRFVIHSQRISFRADTFLLQWLPMRRNPAQRV